MEADSFKTISTEGTGIYKEKGSKFIAHAYPVSSEDDIRLKLENLKKKYHDARHHCYAYRLGADNQNYRANDDGEPSNSAGKPILGQIDSKNLSDVLVVVVRYFGGTLLGVGGLIQAYKNSAKEALKNAHIVDKFIFKIYSIEFLYENMNTVMKVLKEMDIDQFDQEFEMNCKLKVLVKRSQSKNFEKAFALEKDIKLNHLGEK